MKITERATGLVEQDCAKLVEIFKSMDSRMIMTSANLEFLLLTNAVAEGNDGCIAFLQFISATN